MLDQHTIIAGTTGAGKTHLERRILDKIIADKSAQLILIDPKMFELSEYEDSPAVIDYACTAQQIDDAVVHAYDTMMCRCRQMRKDKEHAWHGSPLYVFVDEMLALTSDKQLKNAVKRLGQIAFLGRAPKVFIIICTQLPTRRTLPETLVSNINDKVCLRLDNQSRAQYLFGPGHGYDTLPKYGEGYIYTPEIIDGKPRRATEDEIMTYLNV